MSKYFIITVDTEGDNLWNWHLEDEITTYNAKYILRFQELCEKYNFIPVYLTNYEMASCKEFFSIFKEKAKNGKCEIGMHVHAWNSPPKFDLNNKKNFGGQPFITEYPNNIIYEKHLFLKKLIEKNFEIKPVSYRSGRWATNSYLFDVLDKLGFLVDCSITPGISHKKNKGMTVKGANNYRNYKRNIFRLKNNLIEIPMTTAKIHCFHGKSLKTKLRNLIKGKEYWLRTANSSYEEMLEIIHLVEKENSSNSYLEFMLHSSELMPNGSPYFPNEKSIEIHYETLEKLFKYISKSYIGISLKDYYEIIINKI